MSSALVYPGRGATATVRYFFWSYPEWWVIAISGCAWAVMLVHGWQHAWHANHHRMGFGQELAYWIGMVAAMMLPLTLMEVRVTAARSLWERRHRAMVGFLAGYFAPWLVLGMAIAGLRQFNWTHSYFVAGLSFAAAAVWLKTPVRRRAAIACHWTYPLGPQGWRADADCLRSGALIGGACVGSCWLLMTACAFTGHSPIAQVGGMAVGAFERWPFRPRTRGMFGVTLALAGYYLLLAIRESAARAAQ